MHLFGLFPSPFGTGITTGNRLLWSGISQI
jgi:hypothetical protein